ncbi:NAD(P)-binding protein [Aspergillus californicus]
MPALDLQGKKAIITGGGSGIGLSFAKALYDHGCSVLLADLALHASAKEWLDRIQTRPSPRVQFHKTDVTDWTQLEATFDAFDREFGGTPDIIVPGAGVYEPSSNNFWADLDSASHYKVFDVNIIHPIKTTRIAIRRLRRAQKPGVIVHLSSITAQIPSVVNPLYSVSKQAISQFVRCMAPLDGMAGIRVVAVAPGVVDTPLFRDSAKARAHIDLEKDFTLPPDEVVKAMLSLVTSSRYPSGTVLEIGDIGGWREVGLLNDPGPQGRSTLPRPRAKDAIKLVEEALEKDTGKCQTDAAKPRL